MAMNITLTLTAGLGADLGPNFNLTANVGSVTPSTATKTELTTGKSVSVDDAATQVTITSTGTCTNALTLNISGIPATTTTTTTTTEAPTTTTTTTTAAPPATSTLTFEFIGSTYGTSTFKFILPNPLSVDLTITSATVNLYSDFGCGTSDGQASTTTSGTLFAGALEVSIPGPTTCPQSYSPNGAITISGIGPAGHNSTFNVGGTDVTLLYDATECNIPLCDS
jgi:hypothetical protein